MRRRRLKCAASRSRAGCAYLGPNVPGFINADAHLNATFAGGPTGKGKLAILSQAGSVAYLMLRNFLAEEIPFGRFICFGNQADVSETDLLEFLGEDPGVGAICILRGKRARRREIS